MKLLDTTKPIYADIADKGVYGDPYHPELTTDEWEELAKLKAALDARYEIQQASAAQSAARQQQQKKSGKEK